MTKGCKTWLMFWTNTSLRFTNYIVSKVFSPKQNTLGGEQIQLSISVQMIHLMLLLRMPFSWQFSKYYLCKTTYKPVLVTISCTFFWYLLVSLVSTVPQKKSLFSKRYAKRSHHQWCHQGVLYLLRS